MSHQEVAPVIPDILYYSLELCINTRPCLHQMIVTFTCLSPLTENKPEPIHLISVIEITYRHTLYYL